MRISDWSSDVCSSDLIADKAHSKLDRFVAGTPKYDCSGDRSRALHFVEGMGGNYVEAFRCYSARRPSVEDRLLRGKGNRKYGCGIKQARTNGHDDDGPIWLGFCRGANTPRRSNGEWG